MSSEPVEQALIELCDRFEASVVALSPHDILRIITETAAKHGVYYEALLAASRYCPRFITLTTCIPSNLGTIRDKAVLLMEMHQISINRLSKATGLSTSTIHHFLRGQKTPRFDTIIKILDAIGYFGSVEPSLLEPAPTHRRWSGLTT